jgi:hypothetical protein
MAQFCYQAVPEKTLFIDLPGTKGLKIKSILRGSFDKPLVVMMHGRPGSGNDLLQYLGARYLHEQGFSTLRLFMYDYSPDTRNLIDCTLQTHVDDFEVVIAYLRQHHTPIIFAVGHSYGGLTILRSKERLHGVVLWDASHGLAWRDPTNPKLARERKVVGDIVIEVSGKGNIVSKSMYDEDRRMGDTSMFATDKGYPLKAIGGSVSVLAKYEKRYIDGADDPKEYIEVPRAGHNFNDSDTVMLQLFTETSNWFQGILDGTIK